MITITERAEAEIRRIIKEQDLPEGTVLRVGVKGGGCSGLSYTLEFTDQLQDGDEVFSSGDARILVDNKSMLFLHGLTLHHTSGLNGKGFEFQNPNASGTCGCGQSFKV